MTQYKLLIFKQDKKYKKLEDTFNFKLKELTSKEDKICPRLHRVNFFNISRPIIHSKTFTISTVLALPKNEFY